MAFLLILAIVANAIALIVVALRYDPVEIKPGAGALLIAALALAYAFRRLKVRAFWPYFLVCGSMSWLAFYWGALHPALSLVPIVPFLPHEARHVELLEDNPPASPDPIRQAEHESTYGVQAVVFLFGLVNAGAQLQGYGTGTWAVMTASLLGRPLGILLATFAIIAAGLRLPLQLRTRELVVAALATSSGFTTALFMAVGVFPAGPALAESRSGRCSASLARSRRSAWHGCSRWPIRAPAVRPGASPRRSSAACACVKSDLPGVAVDRNDAMDDVKSKWSSSAVARGRRRSHVSHTVRDLRTRPAVLVSGSTLDGPLGHHAV